MARLFADADARIAAGGEDRVTTAVLDVTGRSPRTFADFVTATFASL